MVLPWNKGYLKYGMPTGITIILDAQGIIVILKNTGITVILKNYQYNCYT